MMKKIIYLLFVLFLFCAACKKNQICLSGQFENAAKPYLLLSRSETYETIFLDTIFLQNGRFSHTLTEEDIGIYLLQYDDNTVLSFIAQNGDNLVFSGDARDLSRTYDVQGNEETQLLLESRRKLDQFYDKTKVWSAVFLQHPDGEEHEKVMNLYYKEFDSHKAYLTQFISQNKGKLVTLPAFYQKIGNIAFFDVQKDSALLREIYTALTLTHPNSSYVTDLKEKLEYDCE
ncbi:MAG: DUF4369 domain-containing protein [Lentimicrobiaceae bacterium]|nr:DUF4369 domain-containing protein [Lentimicrobiaceae bacterium]